VLRQRLAKALPTLLSQRVDNTDTNGASGPTMVRSMASFFGNATERVNVGPHRYWRFPLCFPIAETALLAANKNLFYLAWFGPSSCQKHVHAAITNHKISWICSSLQSIFLDVINNDVISGGNERIPVKAPSPCPASSAGPHASAVTLEHQAGLQHSMQLVGCCVDPRGMGRSTEAIRANDF